MRMLAPYIFGMLFAAFVAMTASQYINGLMASANSVFVLTK